MTSVCGWDAHGDVCCCAVFLDCCQGRHEFFFVAALVNNNDVVTRLPPFATHTGFRYYFNRRGERVVIGWWAEKWDRLMGRMFQSVVDGVNDHKMSNYIANMK